MLDKEIRSKYIASLRKLPFGNPHPEQVIDLFPHLNLEEIVEAVQLKDKHWAKFIAVPSLRIKDVFHTLYLWLDKTNKHFYE